jgi:uncharacterized protein (TIGR00369 family)
MQFPKETSLSGAEMMRQLLPNTPYVKYLGAQLTELQPGSATVVLPYSQALVNLGTSVHGGAIASLADIAATAAAWSDAPIPATIRGLTVSLTITYLARSEQEDLLAVARVLHRGRSLVYLDIDVKNTSGNAVAKALVTYKLG